MPQIPFDYHMHSTNSCDCRASMADMCRSAIDKGIFEIAFTEHFNRKPEDMCYEKYNPDQFFKDIEKCRIEFGPQGLTIKAGCEVGEMHLYHGAVHDVLNTYPYDIILGSLHWNRGESVFERSYFNKRDVKTIGKQYFEEMVEMIEVGGFNILSHLDVFKRMGYQVYQRFDIRELEDYVRPVFAACIKQGIAPEINTSALRMSVCQSHPTIDALRWYREMGGELLTIGSDSHRPDHIGFGLDQAITIAKEVGFTHLTKFKDRKVQELVAI
jgi:histidinol-phosphatase (PHP family)